MTKNLGPVGKRGPKPKDPEDRAVKLAISLEPAVAARMDTIAERLGTGRSGAVAEALKAYPLPKSRKSARD